MVLAVPDPGIEGCVSKNIYTPVAAQGEILHVFAGVVRIAEDRGRTLESEGMVVPIGLHDHLWADGEDHIINLVILTGKKYITSSSQSSQTNMAMAVHQWSTGVYPSGPPVFRALAAILKVGAKIEAIMMNIEPILFLAIHYNTQFRRN